MDSFESKPLLLDRPLRLYMDQTKQKSLTIDEESTNIPTRGRLQFNPSSSSSSSSSTVVPDRVATCHWNQTLPIIQDTGDSPGSGTNPTDSQTYSLDSEMWHAELIHKTVIGMTHTARGMAATISNQHHTTYALSQTIVQSLQNPPSLSLITSMRNAYGLFQPQLSSSAIESDENLSGRYLDGEEEEDEDVGGEARGRRGKRGAAVREQHSGYDNADRSTTSLIAGWNTLSMVQGVGILAIPYACVQAGWLALPTLILVTLLTCYTGHLLGDCLYDSAQLGNRRTATRICQRQTRIRSTLSCIAQDVFPFGGRRFTSLLIFADMFGVCVLYLILVGQCTHALLGPLLAPSWPVGYWTAIVGVAAILLILFPRLKTIAWFSVIALIGLHVCVILGTVYCLIELHTAEIPRIYLNSPNWSQFPIALTIFVFSYCAHAAFPGIEGSMREPDQYGRMLNWSFGIAGVVKTMFGLIMATTIGKAVNESITENMHSRPGFFVAMNSAVVITMFFLIPLFFYILGEQLDSSIVRYVQRGYLTNRRFRSWYTVWFLSTRIAVFIMVLLVAILVPKFAMIMSFLGSISGSILSFIFPGLFHLYLFRSRLSLSAKLIRCFLILFGIVMCVLGLMASSMKLLESQVK